MDFFVFISFFPRSREIALFPLYDLISLNGLFFFGSIFMDDEVEPRYHPIVSFLCLHPCCLLLCRMFIGGDEKCVEIFLLA